MVFFRKTKGSVLKRRTVGNAYDYSPAELTGRWFGANTSRLISAVFVAVVYCLIISWIVKFVNFLATDGKDVEPLYTANTPLVDWIKIIGSIIAIYLICRDRLRK